jgi:hypothetical protein
MQYTSEIGDVEIPSSAKTEGGNAPQLEDVATIPYSPIPNPTRMGPRQALREAHTSISHFRMAWCNFFAHGYQGL